MHQRNSQSASASSPKAAAHMTCPVSQSAKTFKKQDAHSFAKSILKTIVKELTGIKYATAKDLPPMLGSGCYGMVFKHPTDKSKVIKVCWRSPKYLEFAAWAWAHKTNPHVPQIDSVRIVYNAARKGIVDEGCYDDGNPNEFGIVIMERLDREDTIYTGGFREELRNGYRRNDYQHNSEHMRELCDALRVMYNGDYLDLHSGNTLSRNMETPVLIDPIAG